MFLVSLFAILESIELFEIVESRVGFAKTFSQLEDLPAHR